MVTEEFKVTKITADSGNVFVKSDKSEVYGSVVVLGINSKVEDFIEMPVQEAEQLKEDIRAAKLEEIAKKAGQTNQVNE